MGRWTAVVVWSAVLGCEPVPTSGIERPLDTDTDLPPTPTDFEGFRPLWFGITGGRFGVDAAGTSAVGVRAWDSSAQALVDQPVSVTVLLTDYEGHIGPLTAQNHCTVELRASGPVPRAVWSDAVGAWFGFEIASPVVTSTCDQLEFPPAWGPVPSEKIAAWRWGAGLNPLDKNSEQAYGEVLGPDPFELYRPYLVGGGYFWEGLEDGAIPAEDDGYLDTNVLFAYEVAAGASGLEQQMSEGFPVLLPRDAIYDGTGVASGYYELVSGNLIAPAELLLDKE